MSLSHRERQRKNRVNFNFALLFLLSFLMLCKVRNKRSFSVAYKVISQSRKRLRCCKYLKQNNYLIFTPSIFDSAMLPFGTQVRGFKPGRIRRIFSGRKYPHHAYLRHVKEPESVCVEVAVSVEITGHFSPK